MGGWVGGWVDEEVGGWVGGLLTFLLLLLRGGGRSGLGWVGR